jgi:hypothetical protein
MYWRVTFNYFLMTYTVLTYACMQTPDYGLPAFHSASKTLKQKPHTHVFPSHMVVIVYIVSAQVSCGESLNSNFPM